MELILLSMFVTLCVLTLEVWDLTAQEREWRHAVAGLNARE
jgi:hypothetical protein